MQTKNSSKFIISLINNFFASFFFSFFESIIKFCQINMINMAITEKKKWNMVGTVLKTETWEYREKEQKKRL